MTRHGMDAPDVLTGGEWKPMGNVLRWVPVEKQTPEQKARLIACPTCHARVDETCKTSGGNPRIAHITRLTARFCPCGARLRRKKQMCEPCRQEARKRTYRSREIRQPTSSRRRTA